MVILARSTSQGSRLYSANSKEEIKRVWEHQKEPWVDTVLILLYSGWRISELLNLKPEDINLQAGTMKGGTKTKAGKDRVVPIHSKIRALVEDRLAEGGPRLISYNGRACSQTQYRVFWADIMKALKMNHTPHECRHTFFLTSFGIIILIIFSSFHLIISTAAFSSSKVL